MPVLDNPKHERFAQHYARFGNATKAYVAAGYSANGAEVSGCRLLSNAKICSRIDELKLRIAEGVIKKEISLRSARVEALQDRWNRMRAVVEERAADPSMENVPGGRTGLLVKQYRQIGHGRDATLLEEFAVDTGLLKEMRAHEQQAAQELGQWTEKHDMRINKPVEEMTYDELATIAGTTGSDSQTESIN